MGTFEPLIIPFSGLSLGNHHFDFQIGDSFFENIECSEVQGGEVQVSVMLERQERMLVFDIAFHGFLTTPCDRCLDPFPFPVEGEERLYVKFGEDFHEESYDVMVIPKSEHRIDLTHIVYEMLILMLPYQRVHPDDEDGNTTCDPEILARMEHLKANQGEDPRWDALKNIRLDNN